MNCTDKIMVIDLEATCWNGPAPEGEISEIIEIGTCLLDIASGQLSFNEGILVQPIWSQVSTFCTELTTITPALLQSEGISFEEACNRLQPFLHYIWASYGAYDLKMMRSQCQDRRLYFPLPGDHINVKALFTGLKRLKRQPGMRAALELLHLPLQGTYHRGIDDARNIARILHWCLQQ